MAQAINRHDAHALALIDRALRDGRFTAECVAQIHRAFEAARSAERRSPTRADRRRIAIPRGWYSRPRGC